MDLDKLSKGEKIAAVSAILLFIFMFFTWFGVEVPGGSASIPGHQGNAWNALDFIPIILVITIAATLAVALIRLIEADFEPAISLNAVVAALGILSVLLIFFRVLDPPSFGSFAGVSIDATRKWGLYLGLFSAAGIAYGGYRAMQEEGTSFADAADRLSAGRGGGEAPPPPPASTPPPPPPPSSGA